MKNIASSLAVGCLGGIMVLGAYKLFETPPAAPAEAPAFTQAVQPAQTITPLPAQTVNYVSPAIPANLDFTMAASKTVDAVVHITSQTDVNASATQYYDPFRDFFGGPRSAQPSVSTGSGVIISDDGYIVTNNHVIEDADKLTVALDNKKTYEAEVIGTDPSTDLALIKIKANDLPFVQMANSDQVKVGEWVLAVGNPFNLKSTVTAGIVSAKGRNINLLQYDPSKEIYPLESFIQTDAAVNPGNSGGALVNTSGDLVGINTAIASRTGSYAGYSFAVPVNIVKKVTNDLLEFGSVQRAFIGVSIRDLNQEMADELGVTDVEGVYVHELTRDGAAYDAGIEPGDIITHVGSVSVKNVPELQEQVARFRPGDKVAVSLKRDGRKMLKNVVLRNRRGETTVAATPKTEVQQTVKALGANFSLPSQNELNSLGISSGVKVTSITGGKLRSSGIREGFIITKVDKNKVTSTEELIETLENKTGGVLLEGIYPNGMKAYYGFGM